MASGGMLLLSFAAFERVSDWCDVSASPYLRTSIIILRSHCWFCGRTHLSFGTIHDRDSCLQLRTVAFEVYLFVCFVLMATVLDRMERITAARASTVSPHELLGQFCSVTRRNDVYSRCPSMRLVLPNSQEVLHSALYSEAIIQAQPPLMRLTSAHEAGHVAAAYLTGIPVATYTLGE